MKDRLLVLSRYSRMGASSRLRTLIYQPWIEKGGFDFECVSFFDDAYLRSIYSGQKPSFKALKYYSQRAFEMRRQPFPALIWLEKEALPWLPWLIENALLPRSVPIVSDYDDAVFHRYDMHRLAPVRWILGRKIDRVMARSCLVMAGNDYLADRARQADAAHVETVPTVVDLDAYGVRRATFDEKNLRVGWIGTPQTWQALAHPIHEVLDPLLATQGAVFRAVGASMDAGTNGTLEIIPWSEDREGSLIQSMDIGVMPLPDTPWARGKCGYKLIQYMACGLPVVASPVGVNADIVEHGVNGFLADSADAWRTAIKTLLNDPDLRHRMGAAGRRKVEEQYSLQVWGPRVARMLRSVVDQAGRG